MCPSFIDSSSVAKLKMEASGIMAKELKVKTIVGVASMAPATIPRGTNTSSTFEILVETLAQSNRRLLSGDQSDISASRYDVEDISDDVLPLSSGLRSL